jgi:hypothetical protein
MNIFITGDSHVGALKRGYQLLEAGGGLRTDISVVMRPLGSGIHLRTPFFIDHGDHAEITEPGYRQRVPVLPVRRLLGKRVIYCLAGPLNYILAGPNNKGPIWSSPTWRSYWVTGMPPTSERPFSVGMLRGVVFHQLRYQLQLMDMLLRLGERVCVVEAPGPFRHHPSLVRASAGTVAGIHALCRKMIMDELKRRTILVAAVPRECVDADGFMLDRYRSENPNDAHHANAEFGVLMIEQIYNLSN